MDSAKRAMKSLESMPYHHKIYPVKHRTAYEVRFVCEGKCLMLYWVDEEKHEVVVARFIYGGRQVNRFVE